VREYQQQLAAQKPIASRDQSPIYSGQHYLLKTVSEASQTSGLTTARIYDILAVDSREC